MRIPLPGQMQVLYNRNFRLYWVGQFISLTGTWMQGLGQSLLVLQLTNSVAALGILNFAITIPTLILSLTGGVAADRWDRRRIMIGTQTALMLIAFTLAALVWADMLTFSLLLVMAVFTGIATAYDLPAQQSLVPDLVEPTEIPQAVAMNQVIFNGSRLLGPAVAAVAVAIMSVGSLYFFNGLSFIAVLTSLALIRLPKGRAVGGARGSMVQSLKEGIGYVRQSPLLRSLMAVSGLSVLLMFPQMAVLSPGYVKQQLHGGSVAIAIMMALGGGASMLGAFAMLWIPVHRRGHVMIASVTLMGIAVSVMAWATSVWIASPVAALLSLGFSMFMGLNATTIQQTAPGAMRGRVMSISGLMFNGVLPFAALLMSFLVQEFSFRPVYQTCAAIFTVAAVLLLVRSGIIGYVPPPQPETGPPHAPVPSGNGAATGAPRGVPAAVAARE